MKITKEKKALSDAEKEAEILRRAAAEKIVIKGILGAKDPDLRQKMRVNALGSSLERLELERIKQVRRRLSGTKPRPDNVRQTGSVRHAAESQAPKAASTVPEYVPRRSVASNTVPSLLAAGVQRSTVELNSMRPMQILTHGGRWSMLQHPVALLPATAFTDPYEDGWGGAAISISNLPGVPADLSISKHVDPLCASELPPDGAIYLSGKLIVEVPHDMSRVGIDIDLPQSVSRRVWPGWPIIDRTIRPGGAWDVSTIVPDHEFDGHVFPHVVNRIHLKDMGIHMSRVSQERRVAIFELAMWRAAADATTYCDLIRRM